MVFSSSRFARLVGALAVSTLLLTACGGGGDDSDSRARSERNDDTDDTDDTEETDDSDRSDDTEETDDSDRSDDTDDSDRSDDTDDSDRSDDPLDPVRGSIDDIVIRASVADLHEWWARTFPDVYPGQAYSGPTAGAWSLRPGETAECGPLIVSFDDVADNAIYAACTPQDDGIFFDTERFIPGLVTSSGQFAGAFIAAHEWAHLIQARGGEANDVDVTQELQADCYAGAWVRHVLDDGEPFEMTTDDIDVALSSLIDVADPVGIGPDTVNAHGSAFDRISAFTTGLKDVQGCLSFQTDPPAIFQMPFTTPEEEANQGNLPIDELSDLVTQDLNTFFAAEVDPTFVPPTFQESDCDGRQVIVEWCPSIGAVAVSPDRTQAFHDFLGDWATATLVAKAYTDSVGIPSQVGNCIVGAFDRALFLDVNANPKVYNLQLSSGDLDESARVFLFQSMDGDGIVSVDNLRAGLLEGLPACEALAAQG